MQLSAERLNESLEDERVFEQIFKSTFKSLLAYAFTIVKEEATAEELVQQVFFKLWEKRETTVINASLKAYLYKSVHNESLNYLKHGKVKQIYQSHRMQQHQYEKNTDPVTSLGAKELETRLRKALEELPEQCRTIFQLSRFEELKYREIAEKLNLSVKTVENQMSKALQILRFKLSDYLVILIVIFLTSKIK